MLLGSIFLLIQGAGPCSLDKLFNRRPESVSQQKQ
jgi:hypothetical protein